eukprot:TRINITY_DN7303_c0_g3_i1.p1 TRINITY_DN7303_c0_g3~~TRINITY_DN7303_c0_g3_i1.p1  ORF type:complete len:122 (+),score=21.90 TRINITY_DN7303_c0_g3_i1:887-1252(+)
MLKTGEVGLTCKQRRDASPLLVLQQETRKTAFSSSGLLLPRRHEGSSAPSSGLGQLSSAMWSPAEKTRTQISPLFHCDLRQWLAKVCGVFFPDDEDRDPTQEKSKTMEKPSHKEWKADTCV